MKLKTYSIKTLYLVALFVWFIAGSAQAATLYFKPQSQTISQGESFLIEIRVDSEGEEINTVKGTVMFPQDLLKAVDFNKGGSILTLWVQEPTILGGEISFMGGTPKGFQGDGLIGKISFLGEKIGEGKVNFREDGQILLHDGKGTPAEASFSVGDYEIVERIEGLPLITSESHPDENKWYRETTFSLYWELKEGAEYSWVLAYTPDIEPDEIQDKPKPKEGLVWMGAMGYEDLEDGTYYFHLKEKLTDEDWSEKVTRRAMIDSTSPEIFEPEIGQESTMFEGKYFLSFATQDEMSGVDYYEVSEVKRLSILQRILQKEERIEWQIVESPYVLKDQNLTSRILVKAIDRAGNERITEKVLPYKIIWEDVIFGLIMVLITGIIVWWIIRKLTRATKNKRDETRV